MRRARRLVLLLLALGGALTSGCAEVKPWERGVLAKAAMNPNDPARGAREAFSRHVFDVREGATGGTGQAGGGCGCN